MVGCTFYPLVLASTVAINVGIRMHFVGSPEGAVPFLALNRGPTAQASGEIETVVLRGQDAGRSST